MKEVRSAIENYILNHDRNKRLLALFLALAILVSFAVPASLIQPANSMTANSNGSATLLSDTPGTSTDLKPAKGTPVEDAAGNWHEGYFTSAQETIPYQSDTLQADDFEKLITNIGVSVTDGNGTVITNGNPVYDSKGNLLYYASVDGEVIIDAGSLSDIKFELNLTYVLNSDDIAKISTSDPCIYYVLPDGFELYEDMFGPDVYVTDPEYTGGVAGYLSADKDTGLVVIQFTDDYIEYIKSKGSATGTLKLSGTMSRSEDADGDSSISLGDLTLKAEFEDKPNDVTKAQGVVTANPDGSGAVITWVVTVTDTGYGLNGWSVTDEKFSGGTNVTVQPSGYGSFSGNTYTFTSEPDTDVVTFTYTETLTNAQIEEYYNANNLTVTNKAEITKGDLKDEVTQNAYLERPSVEKTGTPDYKTEGGSYGNRINWEIVVTHPYGGSLNGYSITDEMLNQRYTSDGDTLVVTANGNTLTAGTDYTVVAGDPVAVTINGDYSEVVISYQTQAQSSESPYDNSVILKDEGGSQIDSDGVSVEYEKSTNLSKYGVYDPQNNCIVWFVTAQSHVGILDGYKVWDSVFNGTDFSLDDITIVQAYSGSTQITDITSATDSISLGSFGTVTFNQATGDSSVQIDSADGTNGVTMVQFSYKTEVTTGTDPVTNQISDRSNNTNVTDTVTPDCQYTIDKSGSYSAANGTIEWTISVKNNTALDTASLKGVVLTDAAFKGMSASDLALSWAKMYSGKYDFVISVSGNVVTVKDSDGVAYATLTIDSENGTITFSDVKEGFNDIGLKYTKSVSDELIKQAGSQTTTVSNTVSADVPGVEDPTPVEETVTVTNPYTITKSGKYDASTGNITWTVEVQSQSTLDGVTITDDAFANLASGTGIEITQASTYNWQGLSWEGSNGSYTLNKDGISYGSTSFDSATNTITITNNGDNGAQYIKFTYQTKATVGDGESEYNTVSSNKYPDVKSDPVTITNPYNMTKNGVSYDPETGLLTWQVTVQNGDNSLDTLDGVVLYDEAFKNLAGDITVTSASYSYISDLTTKSNENGVVTLHRTGWFGSGEYREFGTLTVNSTDGTLTFDDYGSDGAYYYGLHKVTFTYQTKATAEQIAAGKATNTIGTHSSGVGPSDSSSAEIPITKRDDLFTKTYNGQDKTIYGDGESTYTLDWTINVRKDDGYSGDDLVLVDSLTSTVGDGTHYITAEQLRAINVEAKSLSTESYQTLSSEFYTVNGTGAVYADDGTTVLYYTGFEVVFGSGIDDASYRYVQITYETTADVSGVVGEGSGTQAVYTNSATFNNNSASDGFTYTEIPAEYVETIDITVKKTWSDESNAHETRVDSIQFALKQKIGSSGAWEYYDKDGDGTIEVSGDSTDDLFTISTADVTDNTSVWSLVIGNLPKTTSNAEGLEPIYYMVEEISKVEGYTTTYNNNAGYVNTNGSVIEIINTLDCIKVNKTWVDNNNKYNTRTSISVQLQQRAKGSTDDSAWANVEGAVVTLPDANGSYNYTFTGIDASAYEYRVVEENVDGYKTTYSNNGGISSGEISITNTLVSVNVTKVWQGYEEGTILPDITVTLEYSSDNGESWNPYTDANDNVCTATLTSSSLSASWHGLNAKYIYRVVESGAPDGYITTYNGSENNVSIDGVTNQNVTITNTSNNIKVYKVWSDTGNEDKRQNVVLTLYQVHDDGTRTEISSKTIEDTSSSYKSVTWYALDPDGKYVVEEAEIDGYVTSYSTNNISGGEITVTNTYNSIKVKKYWKDINGNYVSPDKSSIELDIYQTRNGVPAILGNITESTTHTGDDGAITGSFSIPEDLKAGDKLTLRFNGGYVQSSNGCLGGSDSDGNWVQMTWSGMVTNGYLECTFDITTDLTNVVIQTWYNTSTNDGSPEYIDSIDYSIQRWTLFKTITITPDESGNWIYDLSDLPTGISPGEYIYKVVEKSISGYTTTYYNNDGVNPTSNQTIELTNTESEQIYKVAYDEDGKVIANGATVKPSTLRVETIDGVKYYLMEYRLSSNKSNQSSWIVDTLPQGWTICEGDDYGPFTYTTDNYEYNIREWSDYYKNNGTSVSFCLHDKAYIKYYIKIPVETLDAAIETNSLATINNKAVNESDSTVYAENKITVSTSTTGETEDRDLLAKTAALLEGKLTYTIVFNPDGKDLANGDSVDLTDEFDIINYILENGTALSEADLSKIEVKLDSVEAWQVDDIYYNEYGQLKYTEVAPVTPGYLVEYKPTETETKEYTFVSTVGSNNISWKTTDCSPGDVVTLTVDCSRKTTADSWVIQVRFYDSNGNNYGFTDINIPAVGVYDETKNTWTATITIPENAVSMSVTDYESWNNYSVNNVSATSTKTTQLSTAVLNMTVPDETPIVIRYRYVLSGIEMTAGDTLGAENSVSFDTGNASDSASAERTEFLISEAVGTITANTSPVIKKVSISDYSVEIAAKFKMAYYDSDLDKWVFAVNQAPATYDAAGNVTSYKPVWLNEGDTSYPATTADDTIPDGTYTFELGSINISLDSDKLYKMIEVSMPFGYEGFDIANDFGTNYSTYQTTYPEYVAEVGKYVDFANGESATFEDLLQVYLSGADVTGPYDSFFEDFEAVYYFAYEGAQYEAPSGFDSTVTTVSQSGELMLNNSEMIEITINKSWDETALEAIGEDVTVKSIVQLYWSTVKKSTGFPESMQIVDTETFSILNDENFENPKTVAQKESAVWGLLPSGYQGKPIYYYVKEVGYIIGEDYYYLIGDEYVLVDGDTINSANPTPIDKNGDPLSDSSQYVIGELKPIYTGNGSNGGGLVADEDTIKDVEIQIQNTAGLKIEKVWKYSNNELMDPEDIPLDEVPVLLYGTRADTGVEELIGEFTPGVDNNWNYLITDEELELLGKDLSDYSSFRAVENVPEEKRPDIYGYNISYVYNTNGPSGTITVTNKDNTPTEIDVTVKKEWSDTADHSADSVTIQLYRTTTPQPINGIVDDGTPYENPVVLDASNSWSNTWNDLEFKDTVSGDRYYYYAVETSYTAASGETYSISYKRSDKSASQTLTVTNYVPGSLNIEKYWVDESNNTISGDSLILPDEILLDIYRRPDEDIVGEGGATLPTNLKVFADGDSITDGYWSPPSPYPTVLQNLLTGGGSTGSTVANAGISGHKISDIPHYGDWGKTPYSSGYDLFTLIIGTNDLNSGSSLDQIISDYTDMLDRLKEVDASTVFFVGGIPHEDFLNDDGTTTDGYTYVGSLKTLLGYNPSTPEEIQEFENAVNARIDDANARIKALVESYEGLEIYYVDIPGALDALVEEGKEPLDDGCHPSQDGYDAIAKAFYGAITAYYGVGTTETPKDIDEVPEDITDTEKYEYVKTVTIYKKEGWKLNLTDLVQKTGDKNYVYYVVEKTTGYTVAYNSNGQILGAETSEPIIITNTKQTDKTSVTVEKQWYDTDSGKRPTEIAVTLQQSLDQLNWTAVQTITLSSANSWKATVDNLEVTDLSGKAYYYRVVETNVPDGYTVTYSASNGAAATAAGMTITVTNTEVFDLTVHKDWADENHILEDGVTINIYRDTVEKEDGLEIMPLQLALTSPADGNLTITMGKTATVEVNKAVTSVSFSNDIATASVNDKTITVTALDTTGDTVMTITDADGQTVQVNITVTDKPTLSLALKYTNIVAGETTTIIPTMSDLSSTDGITYEIISGSDYADLSGNTLTGKAAGQVTVEGTLTIDGETYTAQTTLTVNLSNSFTLDASSSTVYVGSTVTVTPNPVYGTFTYESSNTDVATVASDGTVTGKAAGTTTITATRSDGKTATVEITVQEIPLTVSPESVELAIGAEKQLTVSDSNVTYTPADSSIVSVSETGLIKALAAGETTIAVTNASGKQTKTVTVKVVNGDIFESDSVVVRVPVGESVTITSDTSMSWIEWHSGSIATTSISNSYSIIITGVSAGELSVVVHANDGSTATFTVIAYNKFSVSPATKTLEYGGTVTLTPNTTDTVEYTIKQGSDLIEISENTVTAKSGTEGTAIIEAKNTVTNETATVTIEVVEEIPFDGVIVYDATISNGTTISLDSSKVISSISFELSDMSSYVSFYPYIGNYVSGSWIECKDGAFGYWSNSNCNITSSGNVVTMTFTNSYKESVLTFQTNYTIALASYTITYASTAEASYSLLNRVSYAPRSSAYALYSTGTTELVATITITSSTDWTEIIENLPVYDASGNQYYYWIEEEGANGFTPSYSFSDGDDVGIDADYCINAANPGSAIATVKNTPNDTQTSLPSTGGRGMQRYYVTGIGIMLCALAGIYGFKRRQSRQS